MRIILKYLCLSALILTVATRVDAQDDGVSDLERLFILSNPVTIDLETETDEPLPEGIRKKKKKVKRNTFYGIRSKKGFTRSGFGEGITLELFYFLKEPVEVKEILTDIYWYDYERRMIRSGNTYNPEEGALLHGPYKKVQNGQVLDSGVYYIGRKHGTWMYHDRNDVLVDKEKYYMGWPRESQVRYYDRERTQIREIIPVEFGEREGYYYYFFRDGKIGVRGEYKWGQRIGDWTEYYPSGVRKKVIRYPRSPYSGESPYILREWNNRGREVYETRR